MAKELQEIQYDCGITYIKNTGEHIHGPRPHEFNTPEAIDALDGHFVAFIQSRPKFYKMLYDQTQRVGIPIKFDQKVVSYYEDPVARKGGIVLENGNKEEADVVVAADGVGSTSWSVVGGKKIKASSSGFAIYRTAYPVELALAEPLIRERWENRPEKDKPLFEFWIG